MPSHRDWLAWREQLLANSTLFWALAGKASEYIVTERNRDPVCAPNGVGVGGGCVCDDWLLLVSELCTHCEIINHVHTHTGRGHFCGARERVLCVCENISDARPHLCKSLQIPHPFCGIPPDGDIGDDVKAHR